MNYLKLIAKSRLNLVLVIILFSPHVFAQQIVTNAVPIYILYGGSLRADNLGQIKSNFESSESQRFDNCMSPDKDYWSCSKRSITNETSDPYRPGKTNGEPISYRLELEAYVDHKHFYGHDTYSQPSGALRVDVGWRCPEGFGQRSEGPSSDRKVWCERTVEQSCSAGNPIDAMSGRKYEFKTDYATADGILKIQRRYIDQHTGWVVNVEPRLKVIQANSSASVNGSSNPSQTECIAVKLDLTRYKATPEEPTVNENYPFTVCAALRNNLSNPVAYAWLEDREYRFIGSAGDIFLPEGGFKGPLKVEPVTDNAVTGAEWKLTHQDGTLSYFDGDGAVLKTVFISGDYLDYYYANDLLISKTDSFGRSITYTYNDKNRLESSSLPDGGLIWYEYIDDENENNLAYWLLAEITWPDGASESYAYNEASHALGVRADTLLTGKFDSFGNRIGTYKYASKKAWLSEGYDGTNRIAINRGYNVLSITNSLDVQQSWYFQSQLPDGQKLLTRKVQPAGHGSSYYYYNSEGQLTEARDFNGNKIQHAYDPTHKFRTVTVEGIPASQTGNFTAEGVNLPAGARKTTTNWNPEIAKPIAIAEPKTLTSFVYNGQPDPFNGNETAACTTATLDNQPLPVVCRKVIQATTDTNGKSGFTANLDISMDARQFLYTYNEDGKLISERRSPDFLDVVNLEYYQDSSSTHKAGYVRRATNQLGHTFEYLEYDINGNPTKIVDPNGVELVFAYDSRGRLQSQTANNQSVNFSYDLNGNLETTVHPGNIAVNYTYDGARRLIAIIDSQQNRLEYGYDSEGSLTSTNIVDAFGTTLFENQKRYDVLSRLEKNIQSSNDERTFTYDNEGNLISTTDPKGQLTSQTYDALGRLTKITDAEGGITSFKYNGQNKITSVTDAKGLETTYTYDAFGNLVTLDSPDTGITTFTYDGRGNALTRTDANGVVTEYQYDALDRVTSVTYPTAPAENVTYTYDNTTNGNFGIGRLTGISDASGNIHFHYNSLGQIESKTYDIAGQSYSLEYSYDVGGRLEEITYPSGRTVTYGYDSLGQINSVTTQKSGGTTQTVVSNTTYMPFGPVAGLIYGNGVNQTFSYDLDYRVTGIETSGPSAVIDRDYSYDPNNNIEQITDNLLTVTEIFSYDPLDRLNGANGNYGDLQFAYDAVGNRLQRILTQGLTTVTEDYNYASTSQRLDSIDIDNNGTSSTRLFDYDNAGNMVEDDNAGNITAIQYNHANRPASASSPGNTISYVHNSLGQRTVKTVNGMTRHFHYDEAGQLIAVTDSTGNTIEEFIYLGSMVVAHYYAANDEVYFAHNDHLNTVKALTDANGEIAWEVVSQTPFGQVEVDRDPDGDSQEVEFNLRFPGQYWDEETLTSYNYYRTYDPGLGRYVQIDPIGIIRDYSDPKMQIVMQIGPKLQSLDGYMSLTSRLNHNYGYVDQNPSRWIDPFGLANGDIWNQIDLERWNSGDASAFPDSSNNHTPKSCKRKCMESYGGNWLIGLGVGAAYTGAGGPAGFVYAAGSLGLAGSTTGFAACMDACDNDDHCPSP